jgi:hypothetical protein
MEFIYLCTFLSAGSLITLAVMYYRDRKKTKAQHNRHTAIKHRHF